MKRKLRAIFLDLDDTLYSTTNFSSLARRNAVQAMIDMGLKMPAERLYQELQEVVREFSSNDNDHFGKLLLRIPPSTYSGINQHFLIAAAVIAYHQTKFTNLVPYADAQNFLERISQEKIILGVITAGQTIKQAEKIIRLGLYKYFTANAIFITEQIGISKSNPKLYQQAYNTFLLSPDEVMYVGDHPTRDVDPPNLLNMITVRIRKDGKYCNEEGQTKADYEIGHFDELLRIIEENFILP